MYGLCKRDGRPESVFLKQASVIFIEQMIAEGPDELSRLQTDLLSRTVDFLDGVVSDFAPDEAPKASCQHCIVDAKGRFFDMTAVFKKGPDIAKTVALIGDPARANMLTALMGGKVLTRPRVGGKGEHHTTNRKCAFEQDDRSNNPAAAKIR